MKFILTILVLLSVISISCTDIDIIQNLNPPVNEPIPYPYVTNHFTFYYTSYDSLSMPQIADTAETHYVRILNDLLTDTILPVEVHFYRDHEELAAAVAHIVPNLPSWAIGLSTAKDTIHMIAPKHPSYQYEYMLVVLIHEFTHCVTLNIKSNFGNNPRWYWESVALFEAGQFLHPSQLPYMVNHTPPTLNQLNNFNNSQVYEVGYLLAEYIVENWDRQHFKDLIISNGNIQLTLGVSVSDFQTNWFNFVINKYGI